MLAGSLAVYALGLWVIDRIRGMRREDRPGSLRSQHSASQGHSSDESPDAYEEDYCKACGGVLDYEDCDACGGDGEFDWETLQFEDPLWYGPDDTEICTQCDGKGGWSVCWTCQAEAQKHVA